MSIRSRQRLIDKVTKIGSAMIILAFMAYIGFNTYEDRQNRIQIAESMKELGKEVVELHEFIDTFLIEQ